MKYVILVLRGGVFHDHADFLVDISPSLIIHRDIDEAKKFDVLQSAMDVVDFLETHFQENKYFVVVER